MDTLAFCRPIRSVMLGDAYKFQLFSVFLSDCILLLPLPTLFCCAFQLLFDFVFYSDFKKKFLAVVT